MINSVRSATPGGVLRPAVVVGWTLGACVAGIAGFLVWALYLHDPRKALSIGHLVGDDPWSRAMMPDARWATDELCGVELPCTEAMTSETLTMYRFAERDQAVAAAESFGEDGYLTGWIAVRYEPGALSESQRTSFESGIACINTWVGEQGQDC